MHVPQWLALVIAVLVILFGFYRLYLAVGGPSDEERGKRGNLYRTPRWHHGLVGAILVLVGGALVATAFGWNPLSNEPDPAHQIQPKHGGARGGNELIIQPK